MNEMTKGLRRSEATPSGIDLDGAMRGFTGGNTDLLKDMTVEEIREAWVYAGEVMPWSDEAIEQYLEEISR